MIAPIKDAWAWTTERAHILRKVPAAVVAALLLAFVIRNADTPAFPSYDLPEGFTPDPPPTTAAPGADRPDLLAVGGTTTSLVPDNVGRARLSGVVTGPDGVVPGATVRLERVVAGVTQILDVVAGPDGRYEAAGIGGGRYRLRAFLPPTLAQPRGTVFFLLHDEDRTVDLTVNAFGEPSIAIAIAPNPPLLDQPLNLAVRVSTRQVDPDGFVRSQPLPGGTVTVSVVGGWVARSPTTATTDGIGEAGFVYECRSTTSTQVQVTLRVPEAVTPTTDGSPAPTPTTATFDAPNCVDPATLTTTTTTPPEDGTTTSTTVDSSTTSPTTSTTSPTSSTTSTTSTTSP